MFPEDETLLVYFTCHFQCVEPCSFANFFFPAAVDIVVLSRPPQVAAVAADESCREGEDGPHCSRRRGVLVDDVIFSSFTICLNLQYLLQSSC